MARGRKGINKKASIQDILFIGIVLVAFTIGTLLMYKISTEFNTMIQDNADFPEDSKTAMNKVTNMYPGIIDNSFLFLVVGLAMVAFIMAAMVRIHPIFIGIFIFVLAIVIFLCGVFSNIYQEIASNPEMTELADNLVFMSTIMHILPFIIGIFGSILSVVMFKTWQGAEMY